MQCRFPTPPEVAGQIVSFKEVDFGYEGREQLFKNLDFGIDMQSRLAMVGANGEPGHAALYGLFFYVVPAHFIFDISCSILQSIQSLITI